MLHILLLAASAAASTGPAACALLEDDRARLACYDALFRQAPGEGATSTSASTSPGDPAAREPSPASATAGAAAVTAAGAATDPEDEFGLSGQQRQQRAEAAGARRIDEVSGKIVAIEPSRVGKPAIELENGQRWRQIEATSWPVFEVGETVVIRKASFGSFLAVVPDSGHAAVRVKREE